MCFPWVCGICCLPSSFGRFFVSVQDILSREPFAGGHTCLLCTGTGDVSTQFSNYPLISDGKSAIELERIGFGAVLVSFSFLFFLTAVISVK